MFLPILNSTYQTCELQSEFLINRIITLPKKGDLSPYGSYRGISLTSCSAKLFNQMSLNGIRDPLRISYDQTKMAFEKAGQHWSQYSPCGDWSRPCPLRTTKGYVPCLLTSRKLLTINRDRMFFFHFCCLWNTMRHHQCHSLCLHELNEFCLHRRRKYLGIRRHNWCPTRQRNIFVYRSWVCSPATPSLKLLCDQDGDLAIEPMPAVFVWCRLHNTLVSKKTLHDVCDKKLTRIFFLSHSFKKWRVDDEKRTILLCARMRRHMSLALKHRRLRNSAAIKLRQPAGDNSVRTSVSHCGSCALANHCQLWRNVVVGCRSTTTAPVLLVASCLRHHRPSRLHCRYVALHRDQGWAGPSMGRDESGPEFVLVSK